MKIPVLIVGLSLVLTACTMSQSEDVKPAVCHGIAFHGNIESISETHYQYEDSMGIFVERPSHSFQYFFDEQNIPTSMSAQNKGRRGKCHRYAYNEQKMLVCDSLFDAEGQCIWISSYTYNDKALHENTFEGPRGRTPQLRQQRAYDGHGRLSSTTYYRDNGIKNKRTEYQYDESGRCVLETHTDAYGWIERQNHITYEQNVKTIRTETFGICKEVILQSYSTNGNLLKSAHLDSNNQEIAAEEIEYNTQGKATYLKRYREGELIEQTTYTYDDHGNLSCQTTIDPSNREIARVEYQIVYRN